MAYDRGLADRIRAALAGRPAVREVTMFGGLSFMVNGKLAVGVDRGGDLLLRCHPDRADALLADPAARPAEMGKGRRMSKGWITVGAEGIATKRDLDRWIRVALEYNDAA